MNSNKNSFRIQIKITDDQINQNKIDQGKIINYYIYLKYEKRKNYEKITGD